MRCPHGNDIMYRCAACDEQARRERFEDRSVEVFERLADTLAALHVLIEREAHPLVSVGRERDVE